MTKRKKLEKSAINLLADADKKANEAEKRQNFFLLTSSNALRKKAKDIMDKDIPELDQVIDDLNKKIKS